MIFKDYYRILCIAFPSSASEIKAAYREQSKRWHPDINPDANSVKIMQDINEAYAILKDETKKTRYDKEYLLYLKSQNIKKPSVTNSKNEYQNKENFDYSVQDEQVKQDIHDAHEYAVKLVNEFLQTLKRTSKDAAKGAWDEMKFYLLGALIVSLLGWLIVATARANKSMSNEVPIELCMPIESGADDQQTSNFVSDIPTTIATYVAPKSWDTYAISSAFTISLPPTIELRDNESHYVKVLASHNFSINHDAVVFQQKELSNLTQKAIQRYCRVIIQYDNEFNSGDLDKATDSYELDNDLKETLRQYALEVISPFDHFVVEPTYGFITIGSIKALKTTFVRPGYNGACNVCGTIYLLSNDKEMARIIISYRQSESNLWQSDFENIIKTFKWNTIY